MAEQVSRFGGVCSSGLGHASGKRAESTAALERTHIVRDEAAMRELGGALTNELRVGDVVFLYGELGAGKTTLVRGFIDALGYEQPVRSPTFNLIHLFPTDPPVMHVDLYRVASHAGLG